MLFYLGLAMQLVGLSFVGLCFLTGVRNGDYGKLELMQLVVGSFVFYIGSFFKTKGVGR